MRVGSIGVGLAVVISAITAGCASRDEISRRIAGRWGPDPIIQSGEVKSALDQQFSVLKIIVDDLGIANINAVEDGRWYYVAEWGFNIGRQDCAAYLDNLFRIQREKLRNHDVINAFQVASSAIVTAANPHAAKTLSILAASFGLATSLNDVILESYLFTEAPGLISIKVKQLQDNYQNGTKKDSIRSAAAAYSALQNYYNICLPQSIEGVILDKVAKADVTNDDGSAGSKPKPKSKQQTNASGATPQKTPLLQ